MYRNTVAWFALLIGLSSAIFFFLQEEDAMAINMLFFGLYGTFTVWYFLKILYYARYKATLNEVWFFTFVNLIPLFVFVASPYVPIAQEAVVSFTLSSDSGSFEETYLQLSLLSLLAFPYLVMSSSLLVRSFTRYQFIRLTAHSERGPNAEWVAILSYFLFGGLFFLVGVFASDLLGVTYGILYVLSGLGFVLGR